MSGVNTFATQLLAGLILLAGSRPGIAAEKPKAPAAPPLEPAAWFTRNIQPILAEHCFKCHSHSAEKIKGGLVVDSLAGLLKGGDNGPAVVPGHPEKGLLLKAVGYQDSELQMPPKGKKLTPDQITKLTEWVKLGAPWPGQNTTTAARARGTITDEDRQWWAFQPVREPKIPAPDDLGWSRNPIDKFIFTRLQAEGLKPSPEAGRTALVRRIYFDLVGLPPSPKEAAEFVADEAPDAYDRLVERLLQSPRYGEKWARHWLDLVRYAESDGYKSDDYRPQSWRYRDYVIQSLNNDKPYNRFVQEQLAGDELFPEYPDAIVGTAYFRNGIYEYNNRDVRGQWQRILEDITDTTADAFMGLGLQCARCHDHKFDPLLQKDYYRLQAFFAPLLPRDNLVVARPGQKAEYEVQLAKWAAATSDLRAEIEQLLAALKRSTEQGAVDKFIEEIRMMLNKPVATRTPYEHQIAELAYRQVTYEFDRLDAKLVGAAKERVLALRKKLLEFEKLKPEPLPSVCAVTDVGPVASALFIPKKESAGEIAPGFPTVLNAQPATIKPLPNSTGRRSELARWLTQPENPLTARVLVNRIWQGHFGRGLAANTSDFGKLGEPPTHPELLDWLAARLMADGWSLKELHRLIVTSATYRQGAGISNQSSVISKGKTQIVKNRAGVKLNSDSLMTDHSAQLTRDPDNRLLWRGQVRRLEAEQIRDALLAVTGELKEDAAGGPSTDFLTPRRTIYSKVLRNARDPLLDVFDLAESFNSVPQRNVTTTPTQALLLFNSQMMLRHAQAFAKRLETEYPGGDEGRVNAAYHLAFSRAPKPAESASALKFLRTQRERIGPHIAATAAAPIATEKMPYRDGVAAVISPEMGAESLVIPDSPSLATGDFTIEASVLVRTVDEGGAVRTIAAKWDGHNKTPGWGFAVTGQGSRRKPQTLVMQIIGRKQDGAVGEEAIFSDQTLGLGKPYFVAAVVRLAIGKEPGEVTFYVKDLANDDEPLSVVRVPHKITGGFQNQLSLNLGGRAAKSGGFDGMIDNVRLSTAALPEVELLLNHEGAGEKTAGYWTFEAQPSAFRDASSHANDIRPNHQATLARATANTRTAALADFCHALLNANEFVYVD